MMGRRAPESQGPARVRPIPLRAPLICESRGTHIGHHKKPSSTLTARPPAASVPPPRTENKQTHSLWLNAVLGLVCLVAFSVLQRSCFPRHYRYRLVSNSVSIKPRPLPTKGWSSFWCVCRVGGDGFF
jgi:hypothetical protein